MLNRLRAQITAFSVVVIFILSFGAAVAGEGVYLRTGLLLNRQKAEELKRYIERRTNLNIRLGVYSVTGTSGNVYYTVATPLLSPEEAEEVKRQISSTIPSIELTEILPERFQQVFVPVMFTTSTPEETAEPDIKASIQEKRPEQPGPPGPSADEPAVSSAVLSAPGRSRTCRVDFLSPANGAVVLDRKVSLKILLKACLPAQVLIRLNGSDLTGKIPFRYKLEEGNVLISGNLVPPEGQNSLEVTVIRNDRRTTRKITFVFPQIGLPQ